MPITELLMSLPIKIAIYGCGAAFENLYLKPLRRLERRGWGKVTAMIEPNPQRREVAQKSFPSARVGADGGVLPDFSSGLTIITSPPPLHLEHTEQAMMAGSHILCEKPIAHTVAAGRAMVALSEKYNRLLAIGQTRRFYPCLITAKEWIQAGKLGRVFSYNYHEGGTYSWPVASDAPFRRNKSGGGALLDKGVHALDFLCWIFGSAEVLSHHDDSWEGGTECASETLLNHSGVKGRLVLAWDQEPANGCLIKGETRDLWFPAGPLHDLFHRLKGKTWEHVETHTEFYADVTGDVRKAPRVYYDCFDLQLIQILRAINLGEKVPVDGKDGLIPMGIIESAYARAQPLQQPWLPLVEQRLARERHWKQKGIGCTKWYDEK